MNSALIESLILTHMKAWANFQPTRFAEDNINFTTPVDGIWYRLTVQHGINLMVGMADTPCTRETGIVTIQIFYPSNKNTLSAKRLTDSIATHFQYYTVDKLQMKTASANNIPNREDGYQINVNIPYWFN